MKFFIFLSYFFLSLFPLFGWEGEFRVSGYHPNSSKFRKIYSEWVPLYQIEGSKNFFDEWSLWGNVSWIEKDGRAQGIHYKTNLRLIPLSVGVKRFFCCGPYSLYLGAGVSYAFLRMHDHSRFVIKHPSKQSVGAVVKSGMCIPIYDRFFLDLFVDYLYQPFHFSKHHNSPRVERHSFNAGGVSLGAGIGICL